MTHPHHLAADAALRSLRQAWCWSTVTPEPARTTRTTRTDRPAPTRRQLARTGALLRAERADRYRLTQDRTAPTGAVEEPVNLALVDARRQAVTAVTDSAWIACSDLRLRPLLAYGLAWGLVYRDPFDRAARYLALAVPHTSPPTAGELAELLDGAARRLRGALDIPETRRTLPYPCPNCQYRATLEADLSATDPGKWGATCRRPECATTWPLTRFGPISQVIGSSVAA